MPRLAHLSDLHFGAHDPRLVAAVEEQLAADPPDLVVISGDLTQRARTEQFEQACGFLERLRLHGHQVLAVPGNHDVPLYDVFRRFLSPLTRYRTFIDERLCPVHELPGALVLGINTARSLTFKDGRINQDQMRLIRDTFADAEPDLVKILVTHHPVFALPHGEESTEPVGRHEQALAAIADAGLQLLLAGHHHTASQHSARDLVTRAGSALVVQAGTATSVRLRDESQSFNRLDIAPGEIIVTVMSWTGERFIPGEALRYRSDGEHWRRGEPVDPAAQTPAAR